MDKFKNINTIHVCDDQVIFCGVGVYKYPESGKIVKVIDQRVWYSTVFNNYLLYQEENGGDIFAYNLINEELKKINGCFYLFKNLEIEDYLIINTNNGKVKLDKSLEINEYNLDGRLPRLIIQDYQIKVSNEIICFNSVSNRITWSFKFEDILDASDAKLSSDILRYEDRIIFSISSLSESKSCINFINLLDGKISYIKDNFATNIKLIGNTIYSLCSKQLKVLSVLDYSENIFNYKSFLSSLDKKIDEYTSTGESLGISKSEFSFSPTIFDIKNNLVFFAQERGSQVGVIDMNNKELLWHTEIEVENEINPTIRDIKVCGNKMFVLDQADNLHIFEHTFLNLL